METVARLLTRHELWKTLKTQRADRQIEALAVMLGLKRFHLYLYGHHFTILMDHEPLERIFGPQDSYYDRQPWVFNVGPWYCQHSITALQIFIEAKCSGWRAITTALALYV